MPTVPGIRQQRCPSHRVPPNSLPLFSLKREDLPPRLIIENMRKVESTLTLSSTPNS